MLRALYATRPVIFAPMEDVSDVVFRQLCRSVGAHFCVTEFVNVDVPPRLPPRGSAIELSGGAANMRSSSDALSPQVVYGASAAGPPRSTSYRLAPGTVTR